MPDAHANRPRPAASDSALMWRSLFYFNIYRLVLSCILIVLAITGAASSGAPHRYPDIFLASAITIMTLSGMYFFTINRGRPPFHVQVHLQTALDLTLLALLIHASDGIQSGYGFLMIVSVAAISLMDTRRSAVAYAALGTLLALAETMVGYLTGFNDILAVRSPGFLGVGLFSTALVVAELSRRIRVSEEMVSRRESALADLNALNREIVELIPTGALAIDNALRILVCNGRARALLGLERNPEGHPLAEVSPALHRRILDLGDTVDRNPTEIQFEGRTIQPSTESFGGGRLIFLEDLSHEREQARQVRLAALGRLAAAIAHEIRNPLSAVYQSAQLLAESPSLGPEDADIAAIIRKQSERIERIVASVLLVSRGGAGNPELIELSEWLQRFATRFATVHDLHIDAVTVAGDTVTVLMDPNHLEQILTNLCENALAHATRRDGELVRLTSGCDSTNTLPVLEVVDHGRGIPQSARKQLFEPFFTTRPQGTGLGLYISRELCEANHARLSFEPDREDTVFRITFFKRPDSDVEAGAHH